MVCADIFLYALTNHKLHIVKYTVATVVKATPLTILCNCKKRVMGRNFILILVKMMITVVKG